VIRTLFQVVVLPDRTRVFGNVLGRFQRLGYAAVVAYGVVVAIVASTQYVQRYDPDGVWPLVFALTAGPFVLMTLSPLAAWRLTMAGLVVDRLVVDFSSTLLQPWQWCVVIPVLLAVALHYSRTVVVTVAVLSLVVLSPLAAVTDLDYLPGSMAAVLLVLLIGYVFGARGRAERQIEQERAEKGALVERARIAREMHDVVAHHMSLVVVRCETAPYRIADLPEAGVREFAELGEAARAAITDMQRLLGVLRAADQQADRAPQPGLAQVRELAARSGASVELSDAEVPEAVGLTAYRIVQEALTNAARHAPGSTVSVRVRREADELAVLVRNTPGGPSSGGGGGHGLAGMRERVAVHGGRLTAEPTPDGGFEVRARIALGDK
jgi:signal transduction histidine kinase